MKNIIIVIGIIILLFAIFYILKPKKATTPTVNNNINSDNTTPVKYNYSLTLSSDMRQEGSIIYDLKSNKIGEFAPGLLTTMDKITCSDFIDKLKQGRMDIKANETSVTSSSPVTPLSEEQVSLGENTWSKIVWKQDLDGPSLPSGRRFWYVNQFCTDREGTLFVINFYNEKLLPTNQSSINTTLESFKFLPL